MDRYYFHAHLDDGFDLDNVGHDCASLDEAIAEARSTRIDLMTQFGLDELQIEIEDQHGRTVAKVPRTRR